LEDKLYSFRFCTSHRQVAIIRSIIRWRALVIGGSPAYLRVQEISTSMLVDIVVISLLWLRIGSVLMSFLRSSKLKRKLWWALAMILSIRFLANNLLLFYILFELRLIPILLIILYWGRQPERLSAGLYFIIYTGMFRIPFMVVIVIVFPFVSFSFLGIRVSTRNWLGLLLLMPFLVKMPVIGLHFWLPKAHVEARTSGSMILAGLLLKLGRYGALRVVLIFNTFSIKWTLPYWLLGSIVSSIITFIISDIKKLVAYSRVSHMTFIMLAVISENKLLFIVVVILSLAHGWASIGMFARAGMLRNASGSRLGVLISMESKIRRLIILLGVLLLTNASLPPFPSFFPELALVSLISLSINMIAFFIFLRVVVCYFNTYIYVWFSHKGNTENLRLISRFREAFKLKQLICLSLITLLWLQCL